MAIYYTSNLAIRQGIYYFRKATPRALVKMYSREEIKFSLKTRNPDIARTRCREVSNFIDQLATILSGMAPVPQKIIEDIIKRYFEQLVAKSNETIYLLPQDPKADTDLEIEGAKNEEQRLASLITKNDFNGTARPTALELLQNAGVQLSAHDELFTFLCRGVLRAEKENYRIFREKMLGNFHETLPKDSLFVDCNLEGMTPIPGDEVIQNDILQKCIDEYVELKSHSCWGQKSKSENVRVLKLFASLGHANKNINHITKADIADFRKILLTMPPNYMKKPLYKDLSLKQAIELNHDVKGISAKTFNKYFHALKAFFKWCEDEEKIIKSPVPNTSIQKMVKSNPQEARKPFESDHLQQLFNSPVYKGCKSEHRRNVSGSVIIQDALYWIPLVFLYSGMRTGEICQLRPSDIRVKDGVEYFDVNGDDEKELKTPYSPRIIPIHNELVKLGFKNFCESRGEKPRIFHDVNLAANGDPSQNFSKQFAYYFKEAGLKKPRVELYSMRHNFRDALSRAEVQDSLIKRLMGHIDPTITFGTYGSQFPPQLLASAINRIKYDIDLSHLYPQHGGLSGSMDGKKYSSST